MEQIVFFQNQSVQIDLASAIQKLKIINTTKASLLATVLNIIKENAKKFDENCQFNIEWIGNNIKSSLSDFNSSNHKDDQDEYTDDLYSEFYRCILEYDISIEYDLSRDISQFINYAQNEIASFSVTNQRQIEFASKWMHINITKKVLSNKDVKLFMNSLEKYNEINQKIELWEKSISAREKFVSDLEKTLLTYENAFNFVGLYKGFDDLFREKSKEYFWNKITLIFFGLLSVAPIIMKLLAGNSAGTAEITVAKIVLTYIPYIAWTILILYFFRITHRSMDDVKSQILQIELRKSLCQFVQSYSEFAEIANKKSPETLKKFESLIFSNIAGSQEKIPSTFDGIESIANLIKSSRSN